MTIPFPRHSRERGNPARTLRREAAHFLNSQSFGLEVTNWIPAFARMTGVYRRMAGVYRRMTEIHGRMTEVCRRLIQKCSRNQVFNRSQ
jgi:hypothetical protein